jgi:serine/threonine-protein kinase HipA
MRKAKVFVRGVVAGTLTELSQGSEYVFEYLEGYKGLEISRTMMPYKRTYTYNKFPPFFEGLLPEGVQLDGLLKISKIDRDDFFSQLLAVGDELVGVITLEEVKE